MIGLEFLLELPHGVGVFIEEDSTISGPEAWEALVCLIELLFRQLLFVHLGDEIPSLGMFFAQEYNGSRCLGIERTGRVENSVLDDFLNPGVRDGGFMAQCIVGATVFGCFEEGFRGCHPGWYRRGFVWWVEEIRLNWALSSSLKGREVLKLGRNGLNISIHAHSRHQ